MLAVKMECQHAGVISVESPLWAHVVWAVSGTLSCYTWYLFLFSFQIIWRWGLLSLSQLKN